jgi:Fic family protein
MNLNKSSSYALLYLLGGNVSASEVNKSMPEKDLRSIQRALSRLVELELVQQKGPRNNPSYRINYTKLISVDVPLKLLEDENRPESGFNFELIDWLLQIPSEDLQRATVHSVKLPVTEVAHPKMSTKDLEYLTIELSWKSSALEGNSYTLLDTQLLLTEGIRAKNRTEFETQMILNHKNAIGFIVDNPDLFSNTITFATLEELHKVIGNNLGIDKGIRRRLVKISASNYTPLSNPQQLRESADRVLSIISRAADPFLRSLLALSLVPYLQAFEDGNKRTGRMLANAVLIVGAGKGFSLRKVSARDLALAYLSFYEFNSMKHLSDILTRELS